MGIELPAELTEVAAKAGVSWPKADEDAMRSSATAWREAGDKITRLGTSADGSAARAFEGLSGATGDAARGRWSKIVAPDGDLQRAARGCHAAADRLDHAAKQVGAAKVEIVRELVTLAKNNDAAHASASTGNANALLGLDTLTRGTAANVANLHNTLSSAIRLDSGVDMSHASQPVNTSPGGHGPGGLLAPVGNIVGGVVAPVAEVVAPVTQVAAPVVGAVTAPLAPALEPVAGVVAPAVETVKGVAAPALDAAAPATAPVTAPAAAVVNQVGDAVPGARDVVNPALGAVDGDGNGNGNGRGEGTGPAHGRGEGPPLMPQVIAPAIDVVPAVVQPVADVIPSVQGTLGPIAEGTTQASAAVLDRPVMPGEMHSQPAAPQATAPTTPTAPTAPTGPTIGGPAVGGPVGGAVGGVGAAVPAGAAQAGAAVVGQGGAQPGAPAQQGQAGQQGARPGETKVPDAKAPEAKASDAKVEAKPGEAKVGGAQPGAQAAAGKTGLPGAAASAGQALGHQLTGHGQPANQSGQVQGSGQGPGQPGQGQALAKDGLPKDLAAAKDTLGQDTLDNDALKDPATGDLTRGMPSAGTGETVVSAPQAPTAGVDLGQQSNPISDRLENREQNQALSVPGLVSDVARGTYTAAAVGSWFMAVFLAAGQAPRLAPKPARQLPPPAALEAAQTPRFGPNDHPQQLDTSFPQPAEPSEGLAQDHPSVQALLENYDPLAGMHERDWEALFENEDGTPRWPVEREGGYEDSQPEIVKPGAELDRFGSPEGRVLAKAGTPFAERSLPPQSADEGYRRYRVIRDLPVHRTISAPWFGQPGGGSRYRTTYPVADLVALGYLTEITA